MDAYQAAQGCLIGAALGFIAGIFSYGLVWLAFFDYYAARNAFAVTWVVCILLGPLWAKVLEWTVEPEKKQS